jgi:hypothetical protein
LSKVIEGNEKNFYGNMWAWRTAEPGMKKNGLEEGENGLRVLAR